MTYAQYGTIAAADYNTLVGTNPNTTSGTLNTVWSTGGTTAGYGQTAITTVSTGNSVAATNWANLVNKTSNSASHQGTSITSVTAPVAGGTVTYLSAIPTNLTTIYTSRLNAATQGSTTANTATRASSWSTQILFTHTVSFANGDAARYFFNSGGQLKITCSQPSGTAIDNLWNALATAVGTITISAPSSGTITIISPNTYTGVKKIGGSGTATVSANNGYYALTTANANIFSQTAATGPSGYLGSYISVNVKSNGTQGSNGDTGSIITIYTLWDEVPDGYAVALGAATTVTAVSPETTYLANTWGTVSVTGTVA
jgi:hypothetical protein